MRVSIWQQFASNHSGLFWVVGTFNTIHDARNAYDEIRKMLFDIDRWHREHPEESNAAIRESNDALPPEQNYAQKFNVTWPSTIDWTGWGGYWYAQHFPDHVLDPQQSAVCLIDEAVNIVACTVTVSNPDQTSMTTQPFEAILQHFGAETVGFDLDSIEAASEDFSISNRLRFSAPDEKTANLVEQTFQTTLSGALYTDPPPWSDVLDMQKHLDNSKILRRADIDILIANWQRFYQLHGMATPSTYGEPEAHRLSIRSYGDFRRTGLDFILRDVWFYHQELGMSSLIVYLEAIGCINIDFAYARHEDDL